MKALSVLALTAAIAALAGCVTSPGYGYRGGSGDYYYGQPSVDYNRYGSPYGYSRYGSRYGYPYSYGSGWSLRYSLGYGYPGYGYSRYGYPRYSYPYYPYYPSRPQPQHPRPDHEYEDYDERDGYHYARPAWRNLDGLGRQQAPGNAVNRGIQIDPDSRGPIRVQAPSNSGSRPTTPVRQSPPARNTEARPQRIQRAQRVQEQLRGRREQIER